MGDNHRVSRGARPVRDPFDQIVNVLLSHKIPLHTEKVWGSLNWLKENKGRMTGEQIEHVKALVEQALCAY